MPDAVRAAVPSVPMRLVGLDAMRSIAVICVFLVHIDFAWQGRSTADWWHLFPFSSLFNTVAIISALYILSAYVLALPFFGGRAPAVLPFMVKRFCRLYIPLVTTTLLVFFLYHITNTLVLDRYWVLSDGGQIMSSYPHVEPTELFADDAINRILMLGVFYVMPTPSSWEHVLDLLSLAGTSSSTTLNSVVWSLVHEIRLSMVFPALIILCRDTRRALLVAAALYTAASAAIVVTGDSDMWLHQTENFWVSWLITLRFAAFFIIGILLAKHSPVLAERIGKMARWKILATWLLVVSVFALPDYHVLAPLFAFAISVAVCLCVHSAGTQKILECTPLPWLGKTTYSFYILHLSLLAMVMQKMAGQFPYGAVCLTALVFTFVLSTAHYYTVELWSIKIGRRLGRMAAGFPGQTTTRSK
ncbi:MAG: acyltransferase family protein [Alphaproteobacteria bacterium]|nr:acyltransferase family protein [Alphaproteobacteria bacterium]